MKKKHVKLIQKFKPYGTHWHKLWGQDNVNLAPTPEEEELVAHYLGLKDKTEIDQDHTSL